jgi:hypothetical protein
MTIITHYTVKVYQPTKQITSLQRHHAHSSNTNSPTNVITLSYLPHLHSFCPSPPFPLLSLHIPPHTDLPLNGLPLRPADKSIISLAAAAAVILASKIHEIRPLRTVRAPKPFDLFVVFLFECFCISYWLYDNR